MTTENIQVQLRKGVLELCVLSILEKGEKYPSDILVELHNAKLIVVEGTLYPLLMRLKNDEILTYRWVESLSGPPRKYYRLTENGIQHLQNYRKAWFALIQIVEKLS